MEVGFISGGSGISGLANMDKNSLKYVIQNLTELDEIADVIIIDTGAGIADAVWTSWICGGLCSSGRTGNKTTRSCESSDRHCCYHKN